MDKANRIDTREKLQSHVVKNDHWAWVMVSAIRKELVCIPEEVADVTLYFESASYYRDIANLTGKSTEEVFFNEFVTEENFWIWRQLYRLYIEKIFKPVAWREESWWITSPYILKHFPHSSVVKPNLIAYTENADKGKRDIVNAIKPGTYLNKYFSEVLTPDEIKYWATRQASDAELKIEFIPSTDFYNVLRAYLTNRHGSCMGYYCDAVHELVDYEHNSGSYDFNSDIHPLKVYTTADPVAELAVIWNAENRCYARAWTRPDKKVYIRIYGTEASRKDMQQLLEAQGYKCGDWNGQKFAAMYTNGDLQFPYLDGGVNGLSVARGVVTIVSSDAEYLADSQDGIASPVERDLTECSFCGNQIDRDRDYYVSSYDDDYCEACTDNGDVVEALSITRYGREGIWMPSDNAVYVHGTYYMNVESAERDGWTELDDEWVKSDEIIQDIISGDDIHPEMGGVIKVTDLMNSESAYTKEFLENTDLFFITNRNTIVYLPDHSLEEAIQEYGEPLRTVQQAVADLTIEYLSGGYSSLYNFIRAMNLQEATFDSLLRDALRTIYSSHKEAA